MPRVGLAEIIAAVRGADSFLIMSHPNPDGDAVGSTLAMYYLLRALGKDEIVCINDDPVPRIYSWLPGADLIVRSAEQSSRVPASTVIVVDAGSRVRVGKAGDLAEPAAQWVMIDHHLDERSTGDLAFIDPTYSAVGEIIVELFDEAGLELSREAATCAYVSIVTDTGGFRYVNTTPRSHRIAARLLETGVDAALISSRVFDVMSVSKFEMLRRVLERTQRIGKIPTVREIGFQTTLLIGFIQCIAMIPGTSRSAATIIGAMLLGASRVAAAEFSFFLAIPTMFGATAFEILKNGLHFTGQQWAVVAVGSVVSFAVAYAVVAAFMNYIRRHDFKPFGYYRIVLSVLVLGYFLFLRR